MDDLDFVQKCVNGDKQSWDAFVDKYSRLIYSYIYGTLKLKGLGMAQENIEDLFQGIFLSLVNDNFNKLRSFKAKNGCSLASWLRQVTVNFVIDYLRKLKPALSLDEESEEGFSLKDMLLDKTQPVSEVLKDKERLLQLNDCIQKLDRDDKYFLELHLNRNLALGELTRHFRVSRAAIDMRKFRLIERLRDCFKGKGFLLDL